MAENSKIAWTHHSANFWIGCDKISPACTNCYAAEWDRRFHPAIGHGANLGVGEHWGSHAPRLLRVAAATREAMKYERLAIKEGRRYRVFTNSMADFFEDRPDLEAPRLEALGVIQATPHLDWLILTKRPENIVPALLRAFDAVMVDGGEIADWLARWLDNKPPANVALGTTVESQSWADLRLPALLAAPAATRFLSAEPLLGPIELSNMTHRSDGVSRLGKPALEGIHWVIVGGESGRHARPLLAHWAEDLIAQCRACGVPVFMKQLSQSGRPKTFRDFDTFPSTLSLRQFPATLDYP